MTKHVYVPATGVTVHRGLEGTNHPDTSQLGSHWTTDYDVAKNFANHGDNLDVYGTPAEKGVIVSGTVQPKDTVDHDTPEGKSWAFDTGILPSDSHEKEVTVRPMSEVSNLSALQYRDGKLVGGRFITRGGQA